MLARRRAKCTLADILSEHLRANSRPYIAPGWPDDKATRKWITAMKQKDRKRPPMQSDPLVVKDTKAYRWKLKIEAARRPRVDALLIDDATTNPLLHRQTTEEIICEGAGLVRTPGRGFKCERACFAVGEALGMSCREMAFNEYVLFDMSPYKVHTGNRGSLSMAVIVADGFEKGYGMTLAKCCNLVECVCKNGGQYHFACVYRKQVTDAVLGKVIAPKHRIIPDEPWEVPFRSSEHYPGKIPFNSPASLQQGSIVARDRRRRRALVMHKKRMKNRGLGV